MSALDLESPKFANAILQWFEQHGRKTLPWQLNPTPYRVWVSEIMLQQTQVATVIPFYHRFMDAFPVVTDLAAADINQVLHLWTGLGYYARARNLHDCAKRVVSEYNSEFPLNIEDLIGLPGIGKSTAGAVVSLSSGKWAAILDGNVKRVLARLSEFPSWPQDPKYQSVLWELAEKLTPKRRAKPYNQAMMDMGALICTRTSPKCNVCPVSQYCRAFANETVAAFPVKKPKKDKPTKSVVMLVIIDKSNRIWLQQRPQKGIWGGLWSFPEAQSLEESTRLCESLFGDYLRQSAAEQKPSFRHTFTHYHLVITPLIIRLQQVISKPVLTALSEQEGHWYDSDNPSELGLAAPVKKLIQQLSLFTPVKIEFQG